MTSTTRRMYSALQDVKGASLQGIARIEGRIYVDEILQVEAVDVRAIFGRIGAIDVGVE